MSLAKASLWTAASTLVKIGAGLLVVKLLAVSFGPAGVGQAGNFRQMVTVLGVLAGAGIFNGVTKYVAQHHDDPARLRKVVGTSSAMVLGFSTLMAVIFCWRPHLSVRDYLVILIIRGWFDWLRWCRWALLGEPAAGADEGLPRCGG